MSSAVSALENSMYHFPCYHSWILLKTHIWWFFFMKTKLNKIKKPLQKWFHRKVCFYVMLKSVSRKVAFQNTDVSPLSSPIHSFTYVMQCSVCTMRLKALYFVLKSVHFKNTVAQSSFLSKLWSYITLADVSWYCIKNDHNFERDEDQATVFLK